MIDFKKLETVLRGEPFNVTEKISEQTKFEELLNWDSLKQLSLIVEVEKISNQEFSPESLQSLKKLGDLVK